jgi:hypothetical protein
MGGPQSRYERGGLEKNSLPPPGIEPQKKGASTGHNLAQKLIAAAVLFNGWPVYGQCFEISQWIVVYLQNNSTGLSNSLNRRLCPKIFTVTKGT